VIACVFAITGLGLMTHSGDLHAQARPDCSACVAGAASARIEIPVEAAPEPGPAIELIETRVWIARRGALPRLRETRAPPA
jgi:hypothetical protein